MASYAPSHRILASFGLTLLVLIAVLAFTVGGKLRAVSANPVCVPTVYNVTSAAPPPSGNWTTTSGVWQPSGGFPGCAPGDSASDTNGTPTTLIINSSIPNPIISLNLSCPGCAIDIQSGGQLTLAGPGTISSSSTIIVEPGGTFTIANGGTLTVNSGTSLSVNGGTADVQTGGHLDLKGASVVTNGGTLKLSGGTLSVSSGITLTVNGSGTISVGADSALDGSGTVKFATGSNGVLQLDHDLTVNAATALVMDTSSTSKGTGDVIGSVKRTSPGNNTLSYGNPDNQITITAGTAPTDITVNLVKTAPAGFSSAVQRTYTITPNGGSGITATLRLHYLDSELGNNTPESSLNLRRFNGTDWAVVAPTAADATNNWVESNAVQSFSPWTLSTCTTVVTSNADSGAGSLREAILDACPGGTITFDMTQVTSPITLTGGELAIAKDLTIQGPTSSGLTISGNNTNRVFNVGSAVNFTFSNLTISNGSSTNGGGIYSLGNLTILGSTLTSNSATGGSGLGGAIDSESGILKIINSTISGNHADAFGGGLYNGGTSQTTLTNDTITNNNQGIYQISSNPLLMNNTIVAVNSCGFECDNDIFVDSSSTIDSNSANNLVGDGTNAIGLDAGGNGNQVGSSEATINPLLGPLANNGGPTLTHFLNEFSPAIDTGNNALAVDQNNAALTTDQRGTGFPRIVHTTVDIGAVEVPFTPPPLSADLSVLKSAPDTAAADSDLGYTITVTNGGPDTATSATLTDTLPGNLTFVSLSQPAGWDCSPSTLSVGAGGTLTCSRDLPAGSGQQIFTLVAHIPPGTGDGTFYNNKATVSTTATDSTSENNTADAGTTVSCATNPIVTTSADSGTGSLRKAIQSACVGATITFDMTPGHVTSPIKLTSAELLIDKNLRIQGPGANVLTVSRLLADATPQFRIFNIQSGTVNISGLTITNGHTVDGAVPALSSGGGILNNAGATLNLINVDVSGNQTGAGASSAVAGNGGDGGGVSNSGTLTIVNSTISGNQTGAGGDAGVGNGGHGGGGGGLSSIGPLTIVNSTVSGNQTGGGGSGTFAGSGGNGGGILNEVGTLTIVNSTVSGNQTGASGGVGGSGGFGGGVCNNSGSTADVKNTIIAGNSVASGGQGPDFSGNLTSQDYNLIGNTSDATIGGVTTHNINNQSASLGGLANNGGPTQTMLPQPISPAINAGDSGASLPPDTFDLDNDSDTAEPLPVDQRGFARVVGGNFDIGAVETNYAIGATAGTPQSTTVNTAFGTQLQATVTESGKPISEFTVTFTAPGSGASGTFPGNVTTAIAVTNAAGVATAPVFTANGTGGGPYNVVASIGTGLPTASFALTNLKANQTITFGPLPDKNVGDPDFMVSSTASSGLPVSFSASGQCTVTSPSPGTVHITGVGSCTITASQAGDASFNPALNVQQSFNIGKASQTITFGALANKTFGDPDFMVSATASSGLPVSFSPIGQCTVTSPSPGTVHLTGGGSCTITASQAGDATYNAAPDIQQSFNIGKANQTITFGQLNTKKFGDADFSVSATASSGLPVSFAASGNCTIIGSNQVHITGAGSCTITASQAGNANFNAAPPVARSFEIDKADQTVSLLPQNLPSRTFGDPDFNVTGGASSDLPVTFSATGNCTVTPGGAPNTATVHLTGTGSCTLTATQAGNANYNPATGSQTFQINKANQTITFGPLANKTFGDADFNVSATASSGLTVSFTATGNCTIAGNTVHLTAAGSCTITASQAGDANFNAAPSVPQSFTIAKANQTITFGALANKTFGDADFNVSATASSGLPVSFTATGNCTIAGNTVHLTSAGSCTITASQAGDSNYNAAPTVPQSFTIAKANQTITFGALANKTFGDADFNVSATASSGLPVSFTATGNCTIAGNTVYLTSAGSCTITASQAGDSNYNAAPNVPQSFTISKANQTITFGALANKTFGDADFNVSATASSGLPVSFTATGNCSITGNTVHLTGAGSCTITASQAGNANFNAASDVPQSFTINKAATTTSLTSSTNPSALGQSVTFTATVNPAPNTTTPTGTVQFKDGGVNLGAAVSLNASGVATLTTSALTAGTHAITAEYSGNTNFNPSTGSLSQVVSNRALLKFSQSGYHVGEDGKFITITVNRSGDLTPAVTVDYASPDDSSSMTFLPCSTVIGIASSRCDFTTAIGTLRFASGETSKTFDVLISQDTYVEGPETFPLTLSNPTGGAAFAQPGDASAVVTIDDDDSGGVVGDLGITESNPIDDNQNFVRQHYHDFLNREPDAAGLSFWTSQITNCGANQACIDAAKVSVSASFFLSTEFQQTGYYVERTYKSGFGDIAPPTVPVPVRFIDFLRDTQEVGRGIIVGQGQWQAQLDANKRAFALAFVQRPDFLTKYPANTSALTFVSTLNTNAGSVLTAAEQTALIGLLAPNPADATLRANVLFQVTENQKLQQQESNRAFVLMEYFGYLRRNPDAAPDSNFDGFNFWLNKLNQFNGDFVKAEMVKAFLTSNEYRQRFGPE